MKLNYGLSDVVINWAGGLHHAKKSEVGPPRFSAGYYHPPCFMNPADARVQDSNDTLLQLHTHSDELLGWLQSVGLCTLLCFAPSAA